MTPPSAPPQPPTGIDWVKVIAGALAAVSSAVLLSTLGAAGTVIGAALGSVIVSVTSSLYSQGLARSRAQIAEAHEAALHRVGLAQAEVRRAQRSADADEAPAAEAHLEYADRQLAGARVELAGTEGVEPPAERWTDRLRALPWKRVAVIAAGFFVAAVVVITAFELIAGRPVSSLTGGTSNPGGTSLSRLGGGSGTHRTPKPTPTPTPTEPAPTTSPTASPTSTASPTAEPTSTASPTPSVVPSSSPTATTSTSPAPTPSGAASILP